VGLVIAGVAADFLLEISPIKSKYIPLSIGKIYMTLDRAAISTACIVVAFGSTALAEGTGETGSFICIEDMATGFAVDNTRMNWKRTKFRTNDKYLVRPAKEGEILDPVDERLTSYVVVEFGRKIPSFRCKYGFGWVDDETSLRAPAMRCEGDVGEFVFYKDTLRYLRSYTGDYIHSKQGEVQKEGNAPHILLGSCTRM
jgi:hypothetical protein